MRVVSARASADGGFLDDELLFALYDRLRGSPHWAASVSPHAAPLGGM